MKTDLTTKIPVLVEELAQGKQALSEAKAENWLEEMPAIKEELFTVMSMLYWRLKPVLAERHLNQIQTECSRLLDRLDSCTNIAPRLQALYDATYALLVDVFECLQERYGKLFNFNAYMPGFIFKPKVEHMNQQTNLLLAGLKKKYAELALQNLIVKSIQKVSAASRCTFHKMMYMEDSIVTMLQICEDSERENINALIKEHLLVVNLNTEDHIKYYVKKITAELENLPDVDDQYQLLYNYEDQFYRRHKRKGSVFFESRNRNILKTLKDYLTSRMREVGCRQRPVIASLSTVKAGNVVVPVATPLAAAPAPEYRVKVSFSADVLVYFLQLLIKTGAIIGSKAKLMLYVAKCVETPGIGEALLSPKSLERKSTQVVRNTAMQLRALLMKMLKLIDEEFS
ncbi:hypothetical protein LPB86_06715 [Pedobacter sp. MC2016-14]|uniref:hypothetical protein n=1 Tax=Pedobacter sp. MC2016-14 TaxID=2897327 RepID=UPI001E3F2054|nr:hypothetical protein [Pedobacter sp. MC2016-14]MCD0487913.1 hypothetical protein [Pedobacter sp. MC2016-14]